MPFSSSGRMRRNGRVYDIYIIDLVTRAQTSHHDSYESKVVILLCSQEVKSDIKLEASTPRRAGPLVENGLIIFALH